MTQFKYRRKQGETDWGEKSVVHMFRHAWTDTQGTPLLTIGQPATVNRQSSITLRQQTFAQIAVGPPLSSFLAAALTNGEGTL